MPAALAVSLVLVLLAAACGSSGSDSEGADGTGSGSTEIEGIVRDDPLQVGTTELPEVQADGTTAPFAFTAPEGKLLFVNFGYTNCPDVCPTTLSDISRALEDLDGQADQVEVAFATVDPERDTTEVMGQYLGSFVDDGHALRAETPEQLVAAEEAFGITSEVVKNDDGSTDVAHTARSFVVDDQGEVVVEWSFGTTSEVMASDLRLLLAQQS